jgi:hypothetical protein
VSPESAAGEREREGGEGEGGRAGVREEEVRAREREREIESVFFVTDSAREKREREITCLR